jgi:hypothetical protein
MMEKDDEALPVSRRDCLLGGGAALLAAAQPVEAAVPEVRLSAPPGHRKDAPGFRPLILDK